MPVIFNLDITINADKWSDEEQKQAFIKNFTDVINAGLFEMTVPDWEVSNVTVKYED